MLKNYLPIVKREYYEIIEENKKDDKYIDKGGIEVYNKNE